MASQSPILVEEKSGVRILTLNRPKQLNVLSFDMHIHTELTLALGQGRAFCAGGDVKPTVGNIVQGKWRLSADIFAEEYKLDYVTATYSKTQVSILNGIVMGGGAGLSVHGRFRIATENTVFAMPETALGLFPDVGASYFLSRLPGFFGEYVGLTGARLDGAEMLACGLATHFVPSTRLSALEADLCRVGGSNDPSFVSTILDAYTQHPHLKQQSAYHSLDVIDRCFSRRTIEEIISALEREATHETNDWILTTISALKKASPSSLKISLRSIREGRLQGVGQCLIREYRMVCHVMKGDLSNDFVEGCRAILVDKDRNPKWEPRRLEDMKDSMVDQYFERVEEEEGWEDLKFPPRNNLPAIAIAAKL
ncbi:Enoyl-CoA hydratase/isomerase HIBYL-CoA-H type [Arabidopsis thaliana x Arabidopsis arenosa]|uniref:3-hydroxyisobutyryl-CoA hydrolase n=1 Tax=Arabidopsis thaliana x Arabidopsis arenosa TaxID=1240361 RepID=A0A8T2A927_9BRAS|nr:Enoyl-CoA hydratase/isomerase HIBYL-CoA-H type [Arabidopsis thaliana x Arabidopsis arenosa]